MEPVALTEELVSFDTVSSRSNAPCLARVADLLEPLGARITLQRKPGDDRQVNLLARFGPDGDGGLCFAGHSDTVPWDGSMRSTTAAERDGRRMYGRGTCDMKGAIAAMLCAAEAVDRTRLRKPLHLAFTFEEEIGCHGAKLLETTIPLAVDHCLIGEPTGLRPVTVHKGYVTAVCDLQGTPCHSSDPDQGASALHAAVRAVDALLALGPRWKAQADPSLGLTPPYTTINIGMLSAGTARNVVPETASFCIETRPMPGVDADALVAEVRSAVADAVAGIAGVEFALSHIDKDAPFHTADDAPLAAWLVEQTGSATATVPFYTEAQIFNRMGARTVVCGPGEIAQAHRVDEWVELDALEAAAQLYRAAIEEFCT
ncbi:MAG: acetylornithine deacetylase [Proteobacteria bacterium]|nr:acetylornithine deacetylase [Pseudomonadota bacterium]